MLDVLPWKDFTVLEDVIFQLVVVSAVQSVSNVETDGLSESFDDGPIVLEKSLSAVRRADRWAVIAGRISGCLLSGSIGATYWRPVVAKYRSGSCISASSPYCPDHPYLTVQSSAVVSHSSINFSS